MRFFFQKKPMTKSTLSSFFTETSSKNKKKEYLRAAKAATKDQESLIIRSKKIFPL